MPQPHEMQHDPRFMQMGGPATSVPQASTFLFVDELPLDFLLASLN